MSDWTECKYHFRNIVEVRVVLAEVTTKVIAHPEMASDSGALQGEDYFFSQVFPPSGVLHDRLLPMNSMT